MAAAKRRKVKSDAADAHERAKDSLSPHTRLIACWTPPRRVATASVTTPSSS